jgi:hypothetical protein
MATRRSKSGRKLRGVQKWIMAEISALRADESLSTAQIAKRIKKASGKEFHKNSVYLALRKLVDNRSLQSVRQGQEKTYKLGKSSSSSPAASMPSSGRSTPSAPAPTSNALPSDLAASDSAGSTPALPHKLALGEILVLEVSDGQVLTATNLHGRLVMERHPVP